MNIRKYLNSNNWNIGFIAQSPKDLLEKKKLGKINWMKHNYHDRFFADPFILKTSESEIVVLCEEMKFGDKGIISVLYVDKDNYTLKRRQELLVLDTHLSYPAIIRKDGKIFIYPENSQSGKLNVYEIGINDGFVEIKCSEELVNEPLTDATMVHFKGNNYLVSTKSPDSQRNAYLFKKEDGVFKKVSQTPILTSLKNSRQGGDFFKVQEKIFRAAQDCEKHYGNGLIIFEISSFEPQFKQSPLFSIYPTSYKYNLGIHTLNFSENEELGVVDGYGYLYPTRGRILNLISRLKHKVFGR